MLKKTCRHAWDTPCGWIESPGRCLRNFLLFSIRAHWRKTSWARGVQQRLRKILIAEKKSKAFDLWRLQSAPLEPLLVAKVPSETQAYGKWLRNTCFAQKLRRSLWVCLVIILYQRVFFFEWTPWVLLKEEEAQRQEDWHNSQAMNPRQGRPHMRVKRCRLVANSGPTKLHHRSWDQRTRDPKNCNLTLWHKNITHGQRFQNDVRRPNSQTEIYTVQNWSLEMP